MSKQHFDEGSARKYTLTVFLSFVAIFCFVMLMKLWQGDFKPGENENAAVRVSESTESPVEHREKNMSGDSTAVKADSTGTGSSTKKMSADSARKMGNDTTGKK